MSTPARLLVVALSLAFSACGPPASQIWAVSWMPDCGLGSCGTNVTVDHGGAITQRDTGTTVTSNDGKCTYKAPISGQWSGTIFKFTMNGGGCGEILQGFTQGDANGVYGAATSARGSITWNFNTSASLTQTWTASLLN